MPSKPARDDKQADSKEECPDRRSYTGPDPVDRIWVVGIGLGVPPMKWAPGLYPAVHGKREDWQCNAEAEHTQFVTPWAATSHSMSTFMNRSVQSAFA
jgi:hypothetical protein